MFGFWKDIPVLGSFSLAIIVLVGSGIYFTLRLGFVQIPPVHDGRADPCHEKKHPHGYFSSGGLPPFDGYARRPGQHDRRHGAIAAGGPGALFWMWISAFFGMATAFTEGTLAQIFKEKRGDNFVGRPSFLCKAPLRK